MDALDEVMLSQIDQLKYWSGIMSYNGVYEPEWPSRMIFRFVVASSMCYEIVGIKVLENLDILDTSNRYDLYCTGTYQSDDGPYFVREKLCSCVPIRVCLQMAKEDYEAMLKENERKRDSNDSHNLS